MLGSDLGNIDMGNAAQEHIAGIQAEPGRAERDVIELGTQQEAELERDQKEILGLQAQLTSSSAQHGNVTADLEIARAEVAKLHVELMFLTEQHGGSAANLESEKQQINRLEAELLQYRSSAVDLQNARNEIVGLQAQMKYAIGQHGASIAQLASAREEINSLQAELTTVQNDAVGLQTQLKDALGQHGMTVVELASAQEEIASFQVDLQTSSEQNRSYTQDLENARQERSRLLDKLHGEQQSDELLKELIATNESLEKASAARAVAERAYNLEGSSFKELGS